MAQTNAVDIIEEALEAELGPDLISAIDQIPESKLVTMAQAYFEFSQHSPDAVTRREPNELRPFLTFQSMKWLHARFGIGVDPSKAFAAPESDLPALVEDALKRVLLYCHRLVVDDPIIYVMDHFTDGESRRTEWRARNRSNLAISLTLLCYLRPLVQNQTVMFVAQNRALSAVSKMARPDDFNALARGTDFSQFRPEAGHMPAQVRHYWVNVGVESAQNSLAMAEQFPDSFDLFFPDDFFRDAAASVLRTRDSNAGIPERHIARMRQLLRVEIPSLDGLTVEDIVALRDSGDGFVLWRAALGDALQRAASVDSQFDPDQQAFDEIREHMEAARIRILSDVSKSESLRSAATREVRFDAGTIRSAITHPRDAVVDRASNAVIDFARSIGDAALDLRRDEKSIFRHYSLFRPN